MLVLADADDGPVALAARLTGRLPPQLLSCRAAVVLAEREFEAWSLAALPSLTGPPDVQPGAQGPAAQELARDPKGLLSIHLTGSGYSEMRHQPAFCLSLDLELAGTCRSVRTLRREVAALLDAQRLA